MESKWVKCNNKFLNDKHDFKECLPPDQPLDKSLKETPCKPCLKWVGGKQQLIIIGDSFARDFRHMTKQYLSISAATLGSLSRNKSVTESKTKIINFINNVADNKDNKEILILFGINDIWALFIKLFKNPDNKNISINKHLDYLINKQIEYINTSLDWFLNSLRKIYTSSNINFLSVMPMDTRRKAHIKNFAMYYYWLINASGVTNINNFTPSKLSYLYSKWIMNKNAGSSQLFINKFNKIFNIWFSKINIISDDINTTIKQKISGEDNTYFLNIEKLIKKSFGNILNNPYVYTKSAGLNYGYIDLHIRWDILIFSLLKEKRIFNACIKDINKLKNNSKSYLNHKNLKKEVRNFELKNKRDKTYGRNKKEKFDKRDTFIKLFYKGIEKYQHHDSSFSNNSISLKRGGNNFNTIKNNIHIAISIVIIILLLTLVVINIVNASLNVKKKIKDNTLTKSKISV